MAFRESANSERTMSGLRLCVCQWETNKLKDICLNVLYKYNSDVKDIKDKDVDKKKTSKVLHGPKGAQKNLTCFFFPRTYRI